jgi:molybdopterin molybdotransferase
VQAAGEDPLPISQNDECIEIMTGAALPPSTDTVIRYEDLDIANGKAIFTGETILKGQNIHFKGKDKKQGDSLALSNQLITASIISLAASVGRSSLSVKKLPKVVIISTGDELVEVDQQPLPYQIRRSNIYTIQAVLQEYLIAADLLHIKDDHQLALEQIKDCISRYDVILLSGGISMGKFDYIPGVLEELAVKKHFHKVKQRPGKPFWFGTHPGNVTVFAFPGNPVSTFMCLYRFFLPWLEACLGLYKEAAYAVLDQDFSFKPALQYFLQVKLSLNKKAQMVAVPFEGNGSGDFVNLMNTNGFMELPLEWNDFKKGEIFRVWPFS